MTKNKTILIKNIYYMLSYAFTLLNQGEFESIATEEFENLHNLFAAILSKGIGRQLKQGLYREYRSFTGDLPALRGKIDLQGTIHNLLSRKQMLSCEYDELTENNILNQILKSTMLILLRHSDVNMELKAELKKELLFFSSIDTVDLMSVKWSSLRFHRNSASYRILISICQLIAEGLLLTTDDGEVKLASFFDEQHMNRLYEKFILEYYNKEYPELSVSASQIPWALDDEEGTMLPVMQSDITISSENATLIIDAKYYSHTLQSQYDVHTIHSANLYQIFTYVKNKTVQFRNKEISGLLLYAKTDEALQPDKTYHMSGNRISVRTLDLNKDFVNIALQLDSIVTEHFFKS